MTETDSNAAPAPPRRAQEAFLGLGGVAFVAMILCLIAYRVFGAQLTDGLDQACAEAAFLAGQKFEASGNRPQAVSKYRQAMGGRFRDEETRFMCGRAIGDNLVKMDRFAEAVQAYESLPPAAFQRSGSYTGYVTALWRTGALEKAMALGKEWLALAEAEEDQTQQIWAGGVLMNVARALGDTDAAMAYGRGVLELDPGQSTANTLALMLVEQGEFDEARTLVETMLEHTENPGTRRSGERVLERIADAARQQAS